MLDVVGYVDVVSRIPPLARHAVALVRNQLSGPSFARKASSNGYLPQNAVALFFATGPENAYQFEQWRRPLERLAEHQPVFVIVDRPDTGELVLDTSSLPVAFARGSAALEALVAERDVRVVLYCNQVESNFRMLRFPAPVHIQIGHGESDKASSVSNQHKAYDLTYVGGRAGRRRLGEALRGFDAEYRTVEIGRPQLDHHYPGAPDWSPDSGRRVWYAPTWEGDRPSIAYGSLASHGVALVEALLADPGIRVIYRPHPRTGTASRAHAAADQRIRHLLGGAGERHLVDQGAYGWQWEFADICVTDVSAVAYDWLGTRKPLVVTRPVEPLALIPPSPLLDSLPLLGQDQAVDLVPILDQVAASAGASAELASYYFGETRDQASTMRFEAAITEAVRR